jgi:uncharacterized cupin superfamily protein
MTESSAAQALRDKLIRNFLTAPRTLFEHAPHYQSDNAPLAYLSLSTMEYPEICEYPDSGKYMAYDRRSPKGALLQGGKMHRADSDLDYWDGET